MSSEKIYDLLACFAGLTIAGLAIGMSIIDQTNDDLRKQISSLSQELSSIKDTVEYRYMIGQDALEKLDYDGAIKEFETVTNNFPNHPLAKVASEELKKANEVIKVRNEQIKDEERKRISEEGEDIYYDEFYAKSHTGMILGRRYRFTACINTDATCLDSTSEFDNQMLCGVEPQFDQESEYQWLLQGGVRYCGIIVASMLDNGSYGSVIAVHRLH